MTRTPGVFVEIVNFDDAAAGAAWCAWADRSLQPALAALDGVTATRRGRGTVGSAQNIVVCDLANFLLPTTDTWRRAEADARLAGADGALVAAADGTRRQVYRQIFTTVAGDYALPDGVRVLHGAFFESEPAHHDEFNDWYNTEHVLFVDLIDGYRNCRRFQAVDDPSKFLALYDVTTMEVALSDEVMQANSSPWSDRVRAKLVTYRERRLFDIRSVRPAPASG